MVSTFASSGSCCLALVMLECVVWRAGLTGDAKGCLQDSGLWCLKLAV